MILTGRIDNESGRKEKPLDFKVTETDERELVLVVLTCGENEVDREYINRGDLHDWLYRRQDW